MPDVLGEVHGGHPAGTEFALDDVAVGEFRGETFDGFDHGLSLLWDLG
jgi:hypothetical protein